MSEQADIYGAAIQLLAIAQQVDRKLPGTKLPTGTHWLITPEAWVSLRKQQEAQHAITFTGETSQTLLGIPLRIGINDAIPALDLVLSPE